MEGESLAARYNIPFLESSAVQNINIDQVFMSLVSEILAGIASTEASAYGAESGPDLQCEHCKRAQSLLDTPRSRSDEDAAGTANNTPHKGDQRCTSDLASGLRSVDKGACPPALSGQRSVARNGRAGDAASARADQASSASRTRLGSVIVFHEVDPARASAKSPINPHVVRLEPAAGKEPAKKPWWKW